MVKPYNIREYTRESWFFMENVLKRTWAEIDLDALRHNYRLVRKATGNKTDIYAVIKADAYGHGAVKVAHALLEEGATHFAVSNLDEAAQLRQAGITCPILLLSYTPPEEVRHLVQLDVIQTVVSLAHAKALNDAAKAADVVLNVHLKVDTGMSRVGFVHQTDADRENAASEIFAAASLPHLQAEGIFTHFAVADEQDETATNEQFARFMQTVEDVAAKGVRFAVCHCCNSAGLMRFPAMHLDAVRPGIVLYGLAPDSGWMNDIWPLHPAMQLKTTVTMVKTVPAGTKISYGSTFIAEKEMQIATVPIGYADGYSRLMAGKGYMLVNGKKAPLVGRVCMDQSMLDVTDLDVSVGDTVTVFGDGLPAEEYAAFIGTIHYETVCAVGKRVPRVYTQNGQVVDSENVILK